MRFYRSLFLMAGFLAASSGLFTAAQAQEPQKPVATVSFSPLDRLLSDVSYLLRAANFPELGGIVNLMVNQYTQGIDRTKPFGLTVTLDEQMPTGMIFLPLSSRDQFFSALGSMDINPDDLGDGLFEVDANGQRLFVKDANGWLYVAQTEQALANVPSDPAALLGDLPQKYDFAVRVNVQALPQNVRDMATEQMRIGFERTLAEQGDQTAEEQEAARQVGEAQIAQIKQFMAETEQVIFGWAIDADNQKTYMDGAAQFLEDSKLAKQAEAMKDLTSRFVNFKLPDASVFFRATSQLTEESDKQLMKQNFRNSMTQIGNELAKADIDDESREKLEKLLGTVGELMEQTIEEGTFDGASSVSVTDNTLRVLVGGHIADGRVLERELEELVKSFPSGPSQPKVEMRYETFEGVALHRLTIPVKIDNPEARKVFGDQLKLTVGTSDKAFMVALDPAGDAVLKTALSKMMSAEPTATSPGEGVIELAELLRFAQVVSPNSMLDLASKTIEQYAEKDDVSVHASAIRRGMIYRLTVEEGVLRAIGTAAKSGTGGGGGF